MSGKSLSTSRLAVSLTQEDDKLLMLVKAALESKAGRRMSYAKVIREGIKALADKEGVNA